MKHGCSCRQYDTKSHLLIYLKGGLELQVISGGQDVAESGLICSETTLASLPQTRICFRMNESALRVL